MRVEPCVAANDDWLRLRRALWPECPEGEHREEMAAACADPGTCVQFLAYDAAGEAVGLAEAALRRDYVNGTTGSPVAFLEGLYVAEHARRRGVARALVDAVARWGRAKGCRELASDTQLDNTASQAAHAALGFAETERVVYFVRKLP